MKTGSILLKAFALIIISAIISSCGSKAPETVNAIPKNAAFVMLIDGDAIASKSGVDDITQTQAFKKFKETLPGDQLEEIMEFENIIKDPSESGIGINKESFVFVTSFDDDVTAGFVVEITDEGKFKNILKTQFEKNEVEYEFQDKDGVTILHSDDFQDEICLAWKDGVLLFLGHDSYEEGLTAQMAANLLNNEKENSLASIDNFNDFYKNKKDISFWMNYEIIMAEQKQQLGMYGQMMNFDFSDSYAHAFLNFDKGKIELEFATILNKKLQEMYADFPYMKDGVNNAILDFMPEPSLMSLSFGIDATNLYKYIMEMAGETAKANAGLFDKQVQEMMGMNIEEALATIGGDIIVNIHGFTAETYESYDWQAYSKSDGTKDMEEFKVTKTRLGMPLFVACISIEDEKIVDVLLDQIGSELTDMGGYYNLGDKDEPVFMVYHDDYIYISPEESLIKAYKAGEKAEKSLADTDMAKLISKQGAYYSINLDLETYPQVIKDMFEGDMDENTYSIFKNATSLYEKAEFLPNDIYSGSIVIWLKNDKANSLKQIIHNADESLSMME